MGIFGEKNNPREKLRDMASVVRRQKFNIERNISKLVAENKKLEVDIKRRAKSGNLDEAKILAKELVSGKRTVSRLRLASAQSDCLVSELNRQAATLRLAGSLQASTTVMQSISTLIRLPELQKTMQSMSKEMMKMGLIQEIVEDTMESTMGGADEMEEATQFEVDKILAELTAGELSRAPEPIAGSIPPGSLPAVGVGNRTPIDFVASVEEEDHEEIAEMQARLAALRN